MNVILNLTCKLKFNLSYLILKCDGNLLWAWMLVSISFTWLPFVVQMMLGIFKKDKRGTFCDKKCQHGELKPAPISALSDRQKSGQIPNILRFQCSQS